MEKAGGFDAADENPSGVPLRWGSGSAVGSFSSEDPFAGSVDPADRMLEW